MPTPAKRLPSWLASLRFTSGKRFSAADINHI
jgi:hypothetical protein